MRKLIVSFVSVLGALVPVFCSASGGIVVEPAFQEVTFTNEASVIPFRVTLRNDSAVPVTLRPSVVDFGSLDESGGVAFLGNAEELSRKYALASWMRPEKDVLSLGPGESEELEVTIENRESLSPGGHYGALLFQLSNEENGEPNGNKEERYMSSLSRNGTQRDDSFWVLMR
jgi:hypothetical protein